MRKILLILLLFPAWCFAQNGSKPDFIRTPNSNFTIVDWNFKAKTFNLPHYSSITRRPSQDSLGTMFLSTVDQHIYIKKQAGSVYSPLAFLSDIPSSLTFTNDFTVTGSLVGFADILHRTTTPWTIQNTSTTNPALIVNGNGTANLQVWNFASGFESAVTVDGYYRGAGAYSQSGLANGFLAFSPTGTTIGRNTSDATPALKIQQSNLASAGDLIEIQNPAKTVWSLGIGSNVLHSPSKTATAGSGIAHNIIGFVKPSANGDALWGLKINPVLGSSTIATWGSLTGGTGYPNTATVSLLTGGTGIGAVASITVSGGVIQTATIAESGVNYTAGDVLTIAVIDPTTGLPVGTGGTVTVATVTTYTGVVPTMLEVDGGITKVAPSTSSYPSLQIPPGNTYTGTNSGSMWQDGTHLYGYIGGAVRQLDQQIGVASIFGRNGNVVAQNGDYITSQVTESGNLFFTNARVLTAPITGFVSGAGALSPTDNILQAIQKLDGNIAASVTGVSSFATRTGAVVPVAGDYASLTETLTNKTLTSGTNTFPTFNQNTTGTAASAATLTTPRNINGVSFNGSANITITANNPNSLLNGFAILGGSYNGGSAITLRVDTNAGKVATQWKIDSTANAHGASAGYGINSTLFTAGTVAVDTVSVASKAWGMAAFYTKNQILTNTFIFTSFHAHKDSTASASNIPLFSLSNNFISTASTDLFSPSSRWRTHLFNGGVDKTLDFNIRSEGNSASTVGQLLLTDSLAGGARTDLLSIDRFGNFNVKGSGVAFTVTNGNLNLGTAGNKIKIATGSNASIGTSTLVSGTVTVSTTAVATGSTIIVCYGPTTSGTLGFITYGTIVNGTSFVITSKTSAGATNTADTSQINWWIVN